MESVFCKKKYIQLIVVLSATVPEQTELDVRSEQLDKLATERTSAMWTETDHHSANNHEGDAYL